MSFDLFYKEQGDPQGCPLVFIHAFPFRHEMWESQLSSLPEKFRAVTYDIRGLGQSPLGEGQFTMESYVEDLLLLLDHLKTPRAILCGLSLGGYIALRAIERSPERFNGLVLCDTRSEADQNEAKLKRAESIKQLKTQGVQAFAKSFLPNLFSAWTQENNSDLVTTVEEIILSQTAPAIATAQLAIVSRTDTTEALAKIRVPTLILVGEEDRLTPVADARALQQRIPGSRLEVIPQAGHMSNLENPGEFNRHLLSFLEGF